MLWYQKATGALCSKKAYLCHQDKMFCFYSETLYVLEICSDTSELMYVTFLSLECTKICFKHVLFIRNVCLKKKHKSNVDMPRLLIEFCMCLSFLWIKPKPHCYGRGWCFSHVSILPGSIWLSDDPRWPPLSWAVICISNLGSFGGQSSHRENSPATLIYLFSPECQPKWVLINACRNISDGSWSAGVS